MSNGDSDNMDIDGPNSPSQLNNTIHKSILTSKEKLKSNMLVLIYIYNIYKYSIL